MNKILLTTTPTLEGVKINKYIGLVQSNQVAGTGFFSDFTAGFSDFFGGHSGTYRNHMNDLYEDVEKSLTEKAVKLGANAVIGVTIDYDNIAAKSMSMFMVSIKGTAVVLDKGCLDTEIKSEETILKDNLEILVMSKYVEKKLDTNQRLSQSDWDFIISRRIGSLASKIKKMYQDFGGYIPVLVSECLPKYVSAIDYNEAIEIAYDCNLLENKELKNADLFNADKILKLMQEKGIHDYLYLLELNKRMYNKEDIPSMRRLADFIESSPNTGKIEKTKVLFTGECEKFICQCGHKNDPSLKYCEACTKDIKGFTKNENQIIDKYLLRVETLEEVLAD